LRARPARARPREREHSAIGTLTECFNGTAWTVVPRPDTVNKDDQLNAVAELSPSGAWAVGLVRPAGTRSGNPLIVELGDSRARSSRVAAEPLGLVRDEPVVPLQPTPVR
jgi:hypothetical protein